MSKIRRSLVSFALLGGGIYLLYTYGLTDDAKDKLKAAMQTARESYETIKEMALEMQGQVMEDDQPLPNAQATARQWERMGF